MWGGTIDIPTIPDWGPDAMWSWYVTAAAGGGGVGGLTGGILLLPAFCALIVPIITWNLTFGNFYTFINWCRDQIILYMILGFSICVRYLLFIFGAGV